MMTPRDSDNVPLEELVPDDAGRLVTLGSILLNFLGVAVAIERGDVILGVVATLATLGWLLYLRSYRVVNYHLKKQD